MNDGTFPMSTMKFVSGKRVPTDGLTFPNRKINAPLGVFGEVDNILRIKLYGPSWIDDGFGRRRVDETIVESESEEEPDLSWLV